MSPATANGAVSALPERTTPRITMMSPNVATTSPSQMGAPERTWVERLIASRSNIRLATTAPTQPPTICAGTYTRASRVDMPPKQRSASVTTGLKWAPETEPNARMSATRPPAVAIEFSSSCSPVSFGERRWAKMPEPTTTATRRPVPTASAVALRPRLGVIGSRVEDVSQHGQALRDDRAVHPAPVLLLGDQAGL